MFDSGAVCHQRVVLETELFVQSFRTDHPNLIAFVGHVSF